MDEIDYKAINNSLSKLNSENKKSFRQKLRSLKAGHQINVLELRSEIIVLEESYRKLEMYAIIVTLICLALVSYMVFA